MRKLSTMLLTFSLIILVLTPAAIAQSAWTPYVLTNQTTETIYVTFSTWRVAKGTVTSTGYRTVGFYDIAPGESHKFYAYKQNPIYFQIMDSDGLNIKPTRSTPTLSSWVSAADPILNNLRTFTFTVVTPSFGNATRQQISFTSIDRDSLINADGFIKYGNGVQINITDAWVAVVASDPNPPVNIPDTALRRTIEQKLKLPANTPITQADMETLTKLSNGYDPDPDSPPRPGRVSDLTGLEFATNLETLDLSDNNISDLSPLAKLVNLTWLSLSANNISDLSPLAKLVNLEGLGLSGNNISDISPIANLVKLESLDLGEDLFGGNAISDISPLAKLVNLRWLYLLDNAISDISALSGLTNLEHLDLSGNSISDFSPIEALIPNLKTYWNGNQKVTGPTTPPPPPDDILDDSFVDPTDDEGVADPTDDEGVTDLTFNEGEAYKDDIGEAYKDNLPSILPLTPAPGTSWLYLGDVSLSPNGETLAVGIDGVSDAGRGKGGMPPKIELWDTQTERLLRTLTCIDSGIQSVFDLSFSFDGQILAGFLHGGERNSRAAGNEIIQLWDPSTGECLSTFTLDDIIGNDLRDIQGTEVLYLQEISFSPKEELLAVSVRPGGVWILDVHSGDSKYIKGGEQFAWSPNGEILAVTAESPKWNEPGLKIGLWNPYTGALLSEISLADWPSFRRAYMSFRANGELVIKAYRGSMAIVSSTGNVRFIDSLDNDLNSPVALSPSGNILAYTTNDGKIRLWNIETEQYIGSRSPAALAGWGGWLTEPFGFGSDGQTYYSGLNRTGSNNSVVLWKSSTPVERRGYATELRAHTVDVHPLYYDERRPYELVRASVYWFPVTIRNAKGQPLAGVEIDYSIGSYSATTNATDINGQTRLSILPTPYRDTIEDRTKIHLTVRDTTGQTLKKVFDIFFIEKNENQHGATVYKRSDGHETVLIKGLTLNGVDASRYTDNAGESLPFLSLTDSNFTQYLPPRVGKHFRIYGQGDENTCGQTSARMVLSYYGVDVGLDTFNDVAAVFTVIVGTTPDQMRRGLKLLPVDQNTYSGTTAGYPRDASLRDKISESRPPILVIRVGKNGYHHIVVVGYDTKTDAFLIADPGEEGGFYWMSWDYLKPLWKLDYQPGYTWDEFLSNLGDTNVWGGAPFVPDVKYVIEWFGGLAPYRMFVPQEAPPYHHLASETREIYKTGPVNWNVFDRKWHDWEWERTFSGEVIDTSGPTRLSDADIREVRIDGNKVTISGSIADGIPLDANIGGAFRGSVYIVLTVYYQQSDALAAPTLISSAQPTETSLLANYPNPFNPETWIPYQLVKSADVTLTIYAIDGKVVRRLDLGHQPAGSYQSKARAAYWDGRNSVGERVASGLYFYTLTAGDFAATRKMLILK